MPRKAQILAVIDRLATSQPLHGSESLCKLLRYLANHALENPGVPLKEYQIATEVFGRPPDFDPQLDSMVRVQAGRLRSKLIEYYSSEGAADALWVELPKGTYVLNFNDRATPATAALNSAASHGPSPADAAAAVAVTDAQSRPPWKWVATVATLSILLTAAVVIIAGLLLARKTASASSVSSGEAVSPTFPIFWKGFLSGPEEPLVIFSNAQFVGRPDVGMRYFDSAKDRAALTLDHYTGVGEVLAVHDLDVIFASLHQPLRIKRGSLFTLDEAKNDNLIFIGSPSENLALLDIPSTREFTFRKVTSGPRSGNTEIVNAHPRGSEAREYLASPSNQTLTEDYAVVALVPGLNPARSELILAGTTTFGTQAAVEFVCSDNRLQELLKRLAASQGGEGSELRPFEALLHVKIARGVPVESDIIALRPSPRP